MIKINIKMTILLLFTFSIWNSTSIAQNPIFTFVHASDTHVGSYGDYVGGLTKFADTINKEENFSLPDFVIFTGDITNDGTDSQYEECKQLFDLLNIPYYPVAGNHDESLGGYRRVFGS